MHVSATNVNDAFDHLVRMFAGIMPLEYRPKIVRNSSRVGDVLTIEEPVVITYNKPTERVLFNMARDCNPFFHLYESLWMLAGRNDIEPLEFYIKDFGKVVSDDGKTANGAYGHRWRDAKSGFQVVRADKEDGRYNPHLEVSRIDQIQLLIDQLKSKPNSRRAVLNMWNVEDDLVKIDTSKDVCCNLSVAFLIRNEWTGKPEDATVQVLDMTVFNRSNDLIWGALGANAVHFSILQEYMANCIGVGVGVYNQISNNLHVYVENNGGFKPDEWLAARPSETPYEAYQRSGQYVHVPVVRNQEQFDKECKMFVEDFSAGNSKHVYTEPFLVDAFWMCRAFEQHKQRDYERAGKSLLEVQSTDWRIAGLNWISKRRDNFNKKAKS